MAKLTTRKMAALLLAFALVLTLLPAAVLAEGSTDDVVYGYYDGNGVWQQGEPTQELPEGIVSVDKKAEKTGENEFAVTIEVVTRQTLTTVVDEGGSAATVLTIDVSGSMDDCSECGAGSYHHMGCPYYKWSLFGSNNYVRSNQTRLAAAKQVATNFINNYKGDGTVKRYIAIAKFAKSVNASSWFDVSTTTGYNSAVSYINGLSASGGTNMHAGIRKTIELFGDSAVENIDAKNAVILSDGSPTYYIKADGTTGGDGSDGSSSINSATSAEATLLKAAGVNVYTVCFGAKNEQTYSGGPTVSAFLRDQIASTGNAYDADNAGDLQAVFGSITQEILNGFDGNGATVVDKDTDFVVPTIDVFVLVSDDGFEWELTNPEQTTDGGTTTYTYTLEYTVTLDANNPDFEEDKLYPLNGRTYLNMPTGEKVDFPIPAAKGTKDKYTVKFDLNYENAVDAPDDQIVTHSDKAERPTPDPERDGFTFLGWYNDDADGTEYDFDTPVTADTTLFAYWEKNEEISEPEKIDYTVEHYLEQEDGTYAVDAASTEHLEADNNTTVTAVAKTFEGYTLDETNPHAVSSGLLVDGGDELVLKLYYKRNVPVEPEEPEEPGEPEEPDNNGFYRNDEPIDRFPVEERPTTIALPSTGSASTVYIALALVVAGIALAILAKKRLATK